MHFVSEKGRIWTWIRMRIWGSENYRSGSATLFGWSFFASSRIVIPKIYFRAISTTASTCFSYNVYNLRVLHTGVLDVCTYVRFIFQYHQSWASILSRIKGISISLPDIGTGLENCPNLISTLKLSLISEQPIDQWISRIFHLLPLVSNTTSPVSPLPWIGKCSYRNIGKHVILISEWLRFMYSISVQFFYYQ